MMETVTNKYKGWNLKDDKRGVRNFDKNMSHMEIKIENDDKTNTLHFDLFYYLLLYSDKILNHIWDTHIPIF